MSRLPDLTTAIEGLYQAFDAHPLTTERNFCDNCNDDADWELTRSRPLRDLSLQDLERYAAEATCDHWGDDVEFRHFLPRLLEIVAYDDFIIPSFEGIFGQLGRFEWDTWPEAEQRSIVRYLEAKWAATLGGAPRVQPAQDVLGGCLLVGLEITPFLVAWPNCTSTEAQTDLLGLLDEITHHGFIPDPYWPEDPPDALQAWLDSPQLRAFLERMADHPDHGHRARRLLEQAPLGHVGTRPPDWLPEPPGWWPRLRQGLRRFSPRSGFTTTEGSGPPA